MTPVPCSLSRQGRGSWEKEIRRHEMAHYASVGQHLMLPEGSEDLPEAGC